MFLFRFVFASVAFVMVVYLLRHYVFTAIVLIFGRSSKSVLRSRGWEPSVSVVVPAHNEEAVIERLLERVVMFTYPKAKLQVIVVDDGSIDKTGEIVDGFAGKYSFVKAVHRHSATGKAAALNDALKYVIGEIVYFFDADYIPENDFVEKSNEAFRDSEVGLVQTKVRVYNEDKMVSKVVSLERFGGFRVNQLARDILGLVPQFGGTAGGVRSDLIRSVGGFDEGIFAEDTDFTFRVCFAGFKVRYLHGVESFEEAVDSWRGYWRQRRRWSRGHMQCAFKHVGALMKNSNLSLREKLDGFLLLNIYFVPVLVGLGWLLAALSLIFGYGLWAGNAALIVTLIYLFAGNVAPLSEIIVGAVLEGRFRLCFYVPVLLIAFVLNVFICTNSLFDLLMSKFCRKKLNWGKTIHKGSS
jgi:cellulose synthase/poly-beta-1,6-N-acetylglucosamine synthase-like glycosyltransferase